METAGTSQTQLPTGERKDNCSPSRFLVARLASGDIKNRLRQRDRFHGESFPFVPSKSTLLRSRELDPALAPPGAGFVYRRRIRSRGHRRLSRATEPKRASLNHAASCGGFRAPSTSPPSSRFVLFN